MESTLPSLPVLSPETIRRPDPIHAATILHVGYFLLMVIVVRAAGSQLPARMALTATGLGAIAAAILVELLCRRAPEARATLAHVVLACALIPTAFTSLGWIIPPLRPNPAEPILIQADLALFGVNPTQWAERFHSPIVTEVLQWIYASFYFIPLVLGVWLALRRRWLELDVSLIAVILGFYTSYVGYFLVPARSPCLVLSHSFPLEGLWLVESIREKLDSLEKIKFDCFPSGHTEVSLLVLWYAWRFEPRAFAILVLPITLLIASTIYLRYHYGVDLVAGLFFAIAVVLIVRPIERRLRRMRQS